LGEVTEDDDTDLVDVQVQCDPEGAVLELEQHVGHGRGQPLDVGNSVTGIADAAYLLAGGRPGVVGLHIDVLCVPDLIRTDRTLRHVFFSSVAGPAGGPKLVLGAGAWST